MCCGGPILYTTLSSCPPTNPGGKSAWSPFKVTGLFPSSPSVANADETSLLVGHGNRPRSCSRREERRQTGLKSCHKGREDTQTSKATGGVKRGTRVAMLGPWGCPPSPPRLWAKTIVRQGTKDQTKKQTGGSPLPPCLTVSGGPCGRVQVEGWRRQRWLCGAWRGCGCRGAAAVPPL